MKLLIGIAFVFVLAALAAAGFFMLRKGRGPSVGADKMAKALAARVILSIVIFAIILISYLMGWIQPTGVPLQR